jgi:hypothetical protein
MYIVSVSIFLGCYKWHYSTLYIGLNEFKHAQICTILRYLETPIFEHNGARYKKPIHLLLNIVLNISDRFVCIISPTWSRKNYADNHKESHARFIYIYVSNDMQIPFCGLESKKIHDHLCRRSCMAKWWVMNRTYDHRRQF